MKGKGKRPSITNRKRRGPKPPAPTSMKAEVPRKMGEPELYAAARRLVTKIETLKGLEKRKRDLTSELAKDIKSTRAEVDALSGQLATGVEMVPQRDLFAPKPDEEATKDTGAVTSQDQATAALAHVEKETSPAAAFVASLGERNGMEPREMKRQLWAWCHERKIRGLDERNELWRDVQELTKPPAEPAAEPSSPAPEPLATT